jgi:phosphatidylinositol-bisphosphatase
MESFNKSFNEPNDSSTQQNNRRASMGAAPFDANTSFSVGSTSNPTRETSRSSSIEASSDDGSSSTNPLMNASSGMGANGRYYNPVVMSFIRDDWIKQQLHLREAAYTRFQNTSVVTGTWNVNAKKPLTASEANKLVQWIQLQTTSMQPLRSPTVSPSNLPDIIALGFQEIVDLNAVNVVVNNMSAQRAAAWEESLLYALNTLMSNQQYRVVMSKHLVGIMLIVFVRVDHAPFVKEIYGATAGVGVLGMMGNKGGVAIRMTFYDSTICFVCAHLAAHKENCAGRNADYANILNKIEFGDTDNDSATSTVLIGLNSSNSSSSYTGSSRFGAYEETVPILNHDYVFWIGDLNYRIDGSCQISIQLTIYRSELTN